MTTKITSIGLCVAALFISVGCSTTKSTAQNTNTDKTSATAGALSDNGQKLPPVAEAPRRRGWGNNISPYFE